VMFQGAFEGSGEAQKALRGANRMGTCRFRHNLWLLHRHHRDAIGVSDALGKPKRVKRSERYSSDSEGLCSSWCGLRQQFLSCRLDLPSSRQPKRAGRNAFDACDKRQIRLEAALPNREDAKSFSRASVLMLFVIWLAYLLCGNTYEMRTGAAAGAYKKTEVC
jgi:hypothetical protein